MGLFNFIKRKRETALSTELDNLYHALQDLDNNATTVKTQIMATKIAAQIIAPKVATLKIAVIDRKTGERVKTELHERLNYNISPKTTGYNFWSSFVNNLICYNNAYAIVQGKRLNTTNTVLTLARSDKVTKSVVNEEIQHYSYLGKQYAPEQVFHVFQNSFNGVNGMKYEDELNFYDSVQKTEQLLQSYLQNGGWGRRVWSYRGKLTPEAVSKLTDSIKTMFNVTSTQLDVVAPYGLTFENPTGLSLKEGEISLLRDSNDKRLLSLYGIDLDNLNLEHLYNHALTPILENLAQSIYKYLLTPKEQSKYKISYVIGGQYLGDTSKQVDNAVKLKQAEIITTNQALSTLLSPMGLPKSDDPRADELQNPATSSGAVREENSED